MSRKMKAATAGGLAVLLLAGVGGSFARWYDESTVGAGQITTGNLSLSAEECAWVDQSADAATTTFTPGTDKMVPGDTVECTVSVTPTFEGKNLEAELVVDGSSVIEGETPDWLDIKTAIGAQEATGATATADAVSGEAQDVKVTLYFKEFKDAADNSQNETATSENWWKDAGQNANINLGNLKVQLLQKDRS